MGLSLSTCRRNRIAVLSVLLGVLLVVQTGFTTVDAQDMAFPIDLSVTYEFWINHWIPDETPVRTTLEYGITKWVDKENLIVEYYLNGSRFEDRLDNIKIETTDYPPIWTNVSTWEISDTVQLSGIVYTVAKKTYFRWVHQTDYFECYKLQRSFLCSSNLHNSTSIMYEAHLGLLVGFFKSIGRTDDGSNYYQIHTVEIGIIGTNFDLFYPLVKDPYGTISTTETSPTTSITTENPPTTSRNTITPYLRTNLITPTDGILITAILVEILVLIIIRKPFRKD